MERLNVYHAIPDSEAGGVTFDNVSYSEYGLSSLYEELSQSLEKLEEAL